MYMRLQVKIQLKGYYILYKNTLGVKKRGQVESTSYFYVLHVTKRCDIR